MSPYNHKTKIKSYWIVIAVAVMLLIYLISVYNGLISKNEAVGQQWGNVENVYQARMDKTKNLLSIVKEAADFEKETLTTVVEARSKASSININADDLTPENMAKFEQAQKSFGSALSRLLVTVERYPELQAVQAFRDFQAQYEGMENRITVERRKFNEVAKTYNYKIKRFPGNIVNNMFGLNYEKKPYFEASEGAETAPDIKF